MRKCVSNAICAPQRRRSAGTSAQSYMGLFCLLPRQYSTDICNLAIDKISRLAEQVRLSLTWSQIPEDTFSFDMTQF